MIALAFSISLALIQAAPATSQPLARVVGRGVQIYTCGEDNKWIFLEPEATLRQDGAEVGTHSAGPRWTWKDGSAISGKVTTTTPSADASKNIPSLELIAAPVGGTSGFLSAVTRISRIETQGGVAPAGGCDAQVRGEKLRVPYQATYTFWVR